MRKFILYNIILIISVQSYAQNFQETNTIKIVYDVLSNKSDFPKPHSYNFDSFLIVNDSMAQYMFHRKKKIVRHKNFQVEIGEVVYTNSYNFNTGIMQEQRMLGKDKIRAVWKPNYDWKITTDTKTINGYTVRKATTNSIEIDPEDDAFYGTVTAWFCEEIPLQVGPDRYCGLPGLIMEIEYENTVRKVTLKSIAYEGSDMPIKDISEGTLLEDKRDVIYYLHHNPDIVKKKIRQHKKELGK